MHKRVCNVTSTAAIQGMPKMHLADSRKEAGKEVGVVVGRLALQDGSQSLQTHASVYVPRRQI